VKGYIEFHEDPKAPERKTSTWTIRAKSDGTRLGRVTFYPNWRQYIFESGTATLWSVGCLRDVEIFLASVNEARRVQREAAALAAGSPVTPASVAGEGEGR
jgi:hypothetical protein